MYYNGYGVEQNYAEAFKLYKQAADRGNAKAQNNLGWLYYTGMGVPMDRSIARSWFRVSCQNGEQLACNNLRLR